MFTIHNLRETEDFAPEAGVESVQEIRFPRTALGARQTGLALMRVKPHARQAVAHRHEEAEEIYVVLSGSGRIKLGDEVREIAPLDAIRMAPDVLRAVEGGPDGIEYLAFGARHEGDGTTEPIDRFWPPGG